LFSFNFLSDPTMVKKKESRKEWDVFICHASEDKDRFVRPLAQALEGLGTSVWYDEFSLRLGDSLSSSIDKGISQSRYGLVVISPNFIGKAWPDYELRGLITREIDSGTVIIPIWHGVDRKTVIDFSPTLADKLAIHTSEGNAQDIAIKILREVRPDLYDQHPRSLLEKMAKGEGIQELQEEIERLREELFEFQCPYCEAPMVEQVNAPVDPEKKHWDVAESYKCGYQYFAGRIESPCPSDPKFPKLSDFKLEYKESLGESVWKWICIALPKTKMARSLSLGSEYGKTKEEAYKRITENYEKMAKRWK